MRRLSMTDDRGEGLLIEDAGGTLLNVSAWPYTREDLELSLIHILCPLVFLWQDFIIQTFNL